jgi:hypothetical protein
MEPVKADVVMQPSPLVEVPIGVRIHLSHAVVDHLARSVGADLLHLKGPALLPGLRPEGSSSTDVDVLVRPRHLPRLRQALQDHGWEQRTHFETGSVFAHAANWWHDDWGFVDVHVSWPGITIDPEDAFDLLAAPHATHEIANVPVPVPDRVGQLLILVLHDARSAHRPDVDHAWQLATDDERAAARDLAHRLGADVALAAALGELEQFRDDPTYLLWRHLSEGRTSRFGEWRARLAATPGARARARLLTAAFRVNRDHLRMELGHVPSRAEVRAHQRVRIQRALTEIGARVRREGASS